MKQEIDCLDKTPKGHRIGDKVHDQHISDQVSSGRKTWIYSEIQKLRAQLQNERLLHAKQIEDFQRKHDITLEMLRRELDVANQQNADIVPALRQQVISLQEQLSMLSKELRNKGCFKGRIREIISEIEQRIPLTKRLYRAAGDCFGDLESDSLFDTLNISKVSQSHRDDDRLDSDRREQQSNYDDQHTNSIQDSTSLPFDIKKPFAKEFLDECLNTAIYNNRTGEENEARVLSQQEAMSLIFIDPQRLGCFRSFFLINDLFVRGSVAFKCRLCGLVLSFEEFLGHLSLCSLQHVAFSSSETLKNPKHLFRRKSTDAIKSLVFLFKKEDVMKSPRESCDESFKHMTLKEQIEHYIDILHQEEMIGNNLSIIVCPIKEKKRCCNNQIHYIKIQYKNAAGNFVYVEHRRNLQSFIPFHQTILTQVPSHIFDGLKWVPTYSNDRLMTFIENFIPSEIKNNDHHTDDDMCYHLKAYIQTIFRVRTARLAPCVAQFFEVSTDCLI